MTREEAKAIKMSEGRKCAMAAYIAARLSLSEDKPRTWYRVTRSKPFKITVSFTLAAVLVLSVALPVGLANANGPIQGGGLSRGYFAGEPLPPRSPWCFRYYSEHSKWPLGDIPVTVTCGYSHSDYDSFIGNRIHWYNDSSYSKDDIEGEPTDIQIFFLMLQTDDADQLFAVLPSYAEDYEGVADVLSGKAEVGEVRGGSYVYGEIRTANPDELPSLFAEHREFNGVIPQELLIGEEGYIIFDLAGRITFEKGYLDSISCDYFGSRGYLHYTVKNDHVRLRPVETPDFSCIR